MSAPHNYHQMDRANTAQSAVIGKHVWIGVGATILPGVTIGDGAVVVAASVVTRDVAAYAIVAGNPARFVKNRELKDAGSVQ